MIQNNKIPEVVAQTEEKGTENETEGVTKKTAERRVMKEAAGNVAGENFGRSSEKTGGKTTETDAGSLTEHSEEAEESISEQYTEKAMKGSTGNAAEEREIKADGETGRRKKRNRKKGAWIRWGILVSTALAVLMFCMYGFFRDRAEQFKSSPLESYDNIAWLYRNCYMLYKDLYNAQTDETKSYDELFMQPGEGYEWMLSSDAWEEDSDAFQARYEFVEDDSGNEQSFYTLRDRVWQIENHFQKMESEYSTLNSNYDYVIRDNISGFFLTNMSEEDLNRDVGNQFFQIGFTFNEHGGVTVEEEMAGLNVAQIRKFANEAIRSNSLSNILDVDDADAFLHCVSLGGPVNCTVVYRISEKDWTASDSRDMYYVSSGYSTVIYGGISYTAAFRNAGFGEFLFVLFVFALVAGLFLPVLGEKKPWREVKICSLPLEPLLAIGIVIFAGVGALVFDLAAYAASGSMRELIDGYFPYMYEFPYIIYVLINLVCLSAFFFCGWYLGICARAVKDFGIREYIRQRCIFYRIFPFIKGKALKFYDEVCHFDVTKNAHKMILKIVLVNAVILFVISCFWVTGFPITIAYSVVLYFVLRKYISKLQMKYGQLLHATNEIAEGNLNVKITEDLGVFEPFKPQIIRIQNGFKNAVEEEMKSQRMKAELITNVSHDLKTPLTAIITYINLLKDENITEEQRKEYLGTLERKSLRLKVLIEDLFEVSKANSQTVTLNIMDVDIMNLLKQVSFEMSDKLAASNLDVRMNLTDEKIILPLDSQKTYRIYENLLGNIAKYAMPGTRVYINGFRIDDTVIITMKNISAQEITVDTAELTERFVRGDVSRNTEGSGLGLAIAKGFMELQGGELSIEVDGDLFKATTTWRM